MTFAADGTVSPTEARDWAQLKMTEYFNRQVLYKANTAREEADATQLSAEYQAALQAYEDAKVALEALRAKQ